MPNGVEDDLFYRVIDHAEGSPIGRFLLFSYTVLLLLRTAVRVPTGLVHLRLIRRRDGPLCV